MTKTIHLVPALALAMTATGCGQDNSPAQEPVQPDPEVNAELARQEQTIKEWCSIIGEVRLRDENVEYREFDHEAGRTVIDVYSPVLQDETQIICEHSGDRMYTAYVDGLPVDDSLLRPHRVDVDDVSLDTVVLRTKDSVDEYDSLTSFYIYATLTGLEPGPSYCVAIDYEAETTTADSIFMSVNDRPMEIVALPISSERTTYLETRPMFAIDPDENGEAVLRLKSREPATLYDIDVRRCTSSGSAAPAEEAEAGPDEAGEPEAVTEDMKEPTED
ncbi:hypothetical protein [Henriciella sp.]|mgnify:CR=1 FL=1|uniref:hypothetical protein n=1 Tax=Henriciella sp. TaxID=1968823 RepID=UPI000C0C8E24|nr:hypothetical protein [Henriciella sp.]PHR81060.1 MAG: hypothetical protein COA64_03125 [Henriciella sp.]